jgi:hypothetical protein
MSDLERIAKDAADKLWETCGCAHYENCEGECECCQEIKADNLAVIRAALEEATGAVRDENSAPPLAHRKTHRGRR